MDFKKKNYQKTYQTTKLLIKITYQNYLSNFILLMISKIKSIGSCLKIL